MKPLKPEDRDLAVKLLTLLTGRTEFADEELSAELEKLGDGETVLGRLTLPMVFSLPGRPPSMAHLYGVALLLLSIAHEVAPAGDVVKTCHAMIDGLEKIVSDAEREVGEMLKTGEN